MIDKQTFFLRNEQVGQIASHLSKIYQQTIKNRWLSKSSR